MAKIEKVVCDVCGKEANYKDVITVKGFKIDFDTCKKCHLKFWEKQAKLWKENREREENMFKKFFGKSFEKSLKEAVEAEEQFKEVLMDIEISEQAREGKLDETA